MADPAGDAHGVAGGRAARRTRSTELIEHGIDYCVVAVPTIYHLETPASRWPRPACTRSSRSRWPRTPTSPAQLVEAFEAAGLVDAVGHIERYNPALRALRARLEPGELGEIYQVATRRQGPFPDRIADVGVVKDLATHDIDLTAWVTQSPYASVSAHTAHKSGREHEDLVVGRRRRWRTAP